MARRESKNGPAMGVTLQHLFADHLTASETENLFEAKYQGCVVHWSGVVLPRHDMDSEVQFAPSEVLVQIGLVDPARTIYSKPEITAAVWFPGRDTTRFNPGEAIRFSGRLAKIDASKRILLIGNGSLTR